MDPHETPPEPRQPAPALFAFPCAGRQTVWATPPGEQPGSLSPELARLLLNGYTRVGDLVIDIDDDIAFAAAAAATGRRHHAVAGQTHLPRVGRAAGYIDLVLVHWPRPAINPRLMLQACRALLRPNGRLVIVVRIDSDQRSAHLAALIGAARTTGLHLLGHIVAVSPRDTPPSASGDTQPRHGEPEADRTAAADTSAGPSGRALVPHTDLLIFQLEVGHDG